MIVAAHGQRAWRSAVVAAMVGSRSQSFPSYAVTSVATAIAASAPQTT
jgi:hypothetical protein